MAANMFGYDVEECFLDHDEALKMLENAGTKSAWDFATALGDTITEKYESLYVRVSELTNILVRKGAKGHFWICTSPEIASIFETATAGFVASGPEHIQLGVSDIYKVGVINRKWGLLVDPLMEANHMLIGCGEHKMHEGDNKSYGKMTVANFII